MVFNLQILGKSRIMCSHRPKPDLKTFLRTSIVGCYSLINSIQSFFSHRYVFSHFFKLQLSLFRLSFVSSQTGRERRREEEVERYKLVYILCFFLFPQKNKLVHTDFLSRRRTAHYPETSWHHRIRPLRSFGHKYLWIAISNKIRCI